MGRTKIVVMDVSFLEMHEALTPAVEEFNATSATTYIDLQLLPSAGLQQKLVVLIAAGGAPDIFGVEEDQFELLASQGSLLELGQTPEGEPIYGVQHPGRLAEVGNLGGRRRILRSRGRSWIFSWSTFPELI